MTPPSIDKLWGGWRSNTSPKGPFLFTVANLESFGTSAQEPVATARSTSNYFTQAAIDLFLLHNIVSHYCLYAGLFIAQDVVQSSNEHHSHQPDPVAKHPQEGR